MAGQYQRMVVTCSRVISPAVQHADRNAGVINGNTIEDIVSADSVPLHVRVYDFPGHVIAPCLCNYHLHLPASAYGLYKKSYRTRRC